MDEILRIINQQFDGISVTAFLITSVIGIFLLHGAFFIYTLKKEKDVNKSKRIAADFLIVYLCFLIQITFCNRSDGSRNGMSLSYDFFFSRGMSGVQRIYNLLNLILFVPYGVLLAFFWENERWIRNGIIIICISYLSSMGIEICQGLTGRGFFEVSDLVMNTIGGALGGVVTLGIRYWMDLRDEAV